MDPSTIQASFDLAARHHQAGNLRQAEQLYRQILQAQPGHAPALHLLGVLAYQVGQKAQAVDLIRQAIARDPNLAEAYSNLALALQDLGRHDEAVAACRQAIARQPGLAQAHNNLGSALRALGRPDEAIACFRQALALQPKLPQALNNLGSALADQGRADEAIAALQQALILQPTDAGMHRNLGLAWKKAGQFDKAIAAFRQAIALQPKYAEAHIGLGTLLQEHGQWDEAIACFQRAADVNPSLALAHYNLGCAFRARGRPDRALLACRQALALQPSDAATHACLGWALWDQGAWDEALAAFRQALALNPRDPNLYCQVGGILKCQGLLDDAAALFRQALALDPGSAAVHSNLLITMLYNPACDAATIAAEHARWNARHAAPLAGQIRPHANDPSPDRPLRIGFVSPDFRDHVIGRNLVPLFKHMGQGQFEAICYADVTNPDALTEEFRRRASAFHFVAGVSDAALAARIRQDRIDILVDLTLHLSGGRLLLFARKPAPLQVTFAGYPGTTGLQTIDYRLSDPYLDPPAPPPPRDAPARESGYSEETYRLPASFWCYDPLEADPPAVTALPAMTNGRITFGCLNNFCKINAPTLALWTRVLGALPAAQLVLLAEEGSHRDRTRAFLEQQGIARARVDFVSKRPHRAYCALFQQIDISLDTLPYSGHTTSLDSLFMGVPVITRVGHTIVGRAGLSQLTNLNLPEFIAHTDDHFVSIAQSWAADLPRLAALRAALRPRMQASPLMDGPAFAHGIEAAFRFMWGRWCAAAR